MRNHPTVSGRVAALTLAVAGVAAVTAFAASGLASASDVARRAPRATHVGAAASDFVLLQLVDESATQKFVRLGDDGSASSSDFVVPDGRVLVVTGFDATGEWHNTSTKTTVRLWVESADGGTQRVVATSTFDSPQSTSSSAGQGFTGGTSVTYAAGVVLGAGTKLRCDAVRPPDVDNSFNTDAYWAPQYQRDVNVTVRGYLTAAE